MTEQPRKYEVDKLPVLRLWLIMSGALLLVCVASAAVWQVLEPNAVSITRPAQGETHSSNWGQAATPQPQAGADEPAAGIQEPAAGTPAARLDDYGWVNRQQGVVHIPIAQAMQRLVERGLPQMRESGQRTLEAEAQQPAAQEQAP
ncbi:MAG: hypothetical protein V7756_03235 [Halopseudomonas sp.]|uniref:hypothetical protein n=1 Tax=Halopseudomonas sp. TaxID=2901191 RepID=UPI0030031B88